MDIIDRGVKRIINDIKDINFPWKSTNFLITGGAGFLGSWVTDVLVRQGSNVIVIDNLASGLESNINHLKKKENLRFINHDISLSITFEEEIDYIFHMASRASPFEFSKFPIEILKVNTLGILNTLDLAKEHQAKFLYTSTSEIYGNPESSYVPTPETYNGNVNPIGPRSCYDEAKRAGEAFVMAYILENNLDARIVRIFNTYGPRMRSGNLYGRVVPNFISQCKNNSPLTVFGDGNQTRSFSYVTDTVEAIFRSAFLPQTKGEVFNIGNGSELSIITLARKIIDIYCQDSRIEYHPLPIDDPKRRCPDLTKIERLLKWKPKITLEEGLSEFIEWYISVNNHNP